MTECKFCDSCGGVKTYAHQAALPLRGRVQGIDWCIHHIVAALNAGNVTTVASCCGHKKMHGRIDLEDGRVLIVVDKNKADEIDQEVWQAEQHQKHPSAVG